MTTFATDGPASIVLDERERAAWARYAATLKDLDGAAYATAEPPAWEHLQEELGEIGQARIDATAF